MTPVEVGSKLPLEILIEDSVVVVSLVVSVNHQSSLFSLLIPIAAEYGRYSL